MYRSELDLEPISQHLRDLHPDLVWSTANISGGDEDPYVLVAHDLGIPVVTAILSFDNLSSRYIHLPYTHYLVWNERMRDQLIAFHSDVNPAQVSITGTPQFDFHRDPAHMWSREATLGALGLPPDARYILYAASTVSLAPDEPILVDDLLTRMARRNALSDVWLVIRYHPNDRRSRWMEVLGSHERVVLSQPWQREPDPTGWATAIPADHTRWVSSVYHSIAVLNIASTTALDAAILDKPAICLALDDGPPGILNAEYGATHYAPLVDSGGVEMAHTYDELLRLIERAIGDPTVCQVQRTEMVRTECGVVDGMAAQRVARMLLSLAGGSQRE